MIKFNTVTWYSQLLAIIFGVAIFAGGVYVGLSLEDSSTTNPPADARKEISGFEWRVDSSVNSDGMPESEVRIVIQYADGTTDNNLVDEINAECNSEDVETTLALNSEQITCYYAGLGHKFRVIEEGDQYLVQQLTFEEATPENEGAPLSTFETKDTYNIK